MDYRTVFDHKGNPYLQVNLADIALLSNPLLNKGMAFTDEERTEFGLHGFLPPQLTTLAIQQARSYEAFQSKSSAIEKYIYLRDLQDSNETLFYTLLQQHIEELMPIVYTPTVGLGCQRFSHIYRRPRGVFLSYPNRHRIDTILAHPRFDHVRAIVVSDGERILGLGDQGAGGMGIPIGKLALYTACAGIHPSMTLPIFLDVGTNNPELQHDPLYIGWAHERIRGHQYGEFIELFVTAVKKRFPHILLQWEDFAQHNASPILQRYRDELCTFNDDIQGTAAVAAGTLLAAIRITGLKMSEQRIVVAGAGSAGCGISHLIKQVMMKQGLSESAACERFFLVDRNGLLMNTMTDLLPMQKAFAQSPDRISAWKCNNQQPSLEDVIANARATVLIGVSGQAGLFTENIVRKMAANTPRPIIFPLSNPTSLSEAIPADLLSWTDERAIIGTGSPYAAVAKQGKLFRIDQTNNSYIFPGIGLGLIAVNATRISDEMFMAAAIALAECSPAKYHPDHNLLPPLSEIRHVSLQIAIAVAEEAIASGVANIALTESLSSYIENYMWMPAYLPYKKG